MTIKQRVHNLIYGENRQAQNEGLKGGSSIANVLAEPDPSRVWGVDISHWDGIVELGVTNSMGASFVFIKGIDGSLQTKYFPENYARAKAEGLPVAPYAWLYRNANVSCVAQARALHNLLQKYPADLPAVIDFEWTRWAGVASNPGYADLDLWVTEFLRLGNRKPLLYSASGYMNGLGRIPDMLKAKFVGLWIANYNVAAPMLPFGYTSWDFWQWTSSGDATKYAPNSNHKLEVDMNYWMGEPTTGGTLATYKTKQNAKLWANFTNGVFSDQIDSIPAGTTVTGNALSGGAVRLSNPVGWTKAIWLEAIATPPPPPPPPPSDVHPVSAVVTMSDGYSYKTETFTKL